MQILVIFSQCPGNNEECAIYKVHGIMWSVHPVNLPGECIMKVEIFVHWLECVKSATSEGIMRSMYNI